MPKLSLFCRNQLLECMVTQQSLIPSCKPRLKASMLVRGCGAWLMLFAEHLSAAHGARWQVHGSRNSVVAGRNDC